jgi:hypothetical protein
MKNTGRIAFLFYNIWFLLVIFLNLKGDITFGHGLGDLYYLLMLVVLTILSLIFYLKDIKKNTSNTYLFCLFVILLIVVIVSFSLKLTLLRGPEYPWNGNFFL